MATVMPGLLPETQGVQFTARPALRTRESLVSSRGRPQDRKILSRQSSEALDSNRNAIPTQRLSSIEVEALLREKVKNKYDDLQQGFQTYDIDKSFSITKGEFRRVLETYCFSMTTEQYDTILAKIERNPNGTVRYCDFLDKFHGAHGGSTGKEKWISGPHKFNQQPAREGNIDMVEKMLRNKISVNLKNVVKGLQLFDYNRDGKIQRHELRRVLENFCFKLTDQQYDKLWVRYDFHHTGTVNYKEFLQRLGINTDRQSQTSSENTRAPNALLVDQRKQGFEQGKRGLPSKTDHPLEGLNFDEIEVKFRKAMKSQFLNLQRAFMAFDHHFDGFISIGNLKAILNQFTIPMSDQLFSQLMDRVGVRGSGRISWEFFLEKFQDPRDVGNGQTIPIKPSHKFFPIQESQKVMKSSDILLLLHNHVNNNYSSIKQAFLQFDKSRNAYVSRKELRKIIEQFTFRLNEEQFKQLMIRLDPQHTNNISYHEFLKLFEEKETPEGHKWLKSVHRFNENQKPTIMAWETIEEILKEKITERWKIISDVIVSYDPKGTGVLPLNKMKRVIDLYVLPVSEDHFKSMVSLCTPRADSKVNYVEFMDRLGVDVSPGDVHGLSSQIHDRSEQAEMIRLGDQFTRQNQAYNRVQERTAIMSAVEVISRLKDRMSQHNKQIRKAFQLYDKSGRGRITKRDFRQVLASEGLDMSDDQFQDLVSKLGFTNGHMNYMDFVKSFEDPQGAGGPGEEIQRAGNHRVDPIRGDEYGMSALEVESKLRNKLRENFADLRSAFFKFDTERKGILTKESFRRLLDGFLFMMSDEEFEVLCNRLKIDKNSRIDYKDFLNRYEVRDTAEGHKWLNSVHRFNEVRPMQYMNHVEVHEALLKKAHNQWKDLAKAFLTMDSNGSGVITRKELRDVLQRFMLPITPAEFKLLWARYDTKGRGYISHQDFLHKLGAADFTPGDDAGTSQQIIKRSELDLADHQRQQQSKHEQITLNQAVRGATMTAEQVEKDLRDKIRDNYSGPYAAFRKYDTKKRGYLSVKEIQKALFDLNYFLDDEEFFRLLNRIGMATNKSRLGYEQFLRAFEEGRKSSYGQRRREYVDIEVYENLSPQEAEIKLRGKVANQVDVLEKAFGAFDQQQNGMLLVDEFRRVLDMFCFKMTDVQFKHLMTKLPRNGYGQIEYPLFLQNYQMNEQEDAEKWLSSVQKSLQLHTPSLMPVDEVQERLHETISAQYYDLARTFADIDYAKIGSISKEDFLEVLTKNVLRLTPEQFETLWASLPVNDFGNLIYRDFLKMYSSEANPPEVSASFPPQTAASNRPASLMMTRRSLTRMSRARTSSRLDAIRPSTQGNRAASRMMTPLVNASSAEEMLKDAVYRHWKDIQRQCRQFDTEATGTITIYQLEEILGKYGVNLSGDDYNQLMLKYDLKENGTFSYVEFLRHFVINLKPKDGALLQRSKLPQTKATMTHGDPNSSLYEAMVQLRECVSQNWKEMRRLFRSIDQTGTGLVNPTEFRHVLRQFSVNMTEEEFFQILSYYDKSMDGDISYNEFIRAYLKS